MLTFPQYHNFTFTDIYHSLYAGYARRLSRIDADKLTVEAVISSADDPVVSIFWLHIRFMDILPVLFKSVFSISVGDVFLKVSLRLGVRRGP